MNDGRRVVSVFAKWEAALFHALCASKFLSNLKKN